MTADQQVLVASLLLALAAYLHTAPFRLHAQVMHPRGAGPPSSTRTALHAMLTPVEGAASAVSRLAAAVIAGCVLWVAGGAVPVLSALAAPVAAVTFIALARLRPRDARRADLAVQAELPAACTLLAVCLEAGLPLRNAVSAVSEGLGGPLGDALQRLHTAVLLGTPETDAWRELGEHHPAFEALARELGHASDSGVALAPLLRQHAREAQHAVHALAQARARRAGVSSVLPLMVCFLPAFILIGVVPIVGGVAARLFS